MSATIRERNRNDRISKGKKDKVEDHPSGIGFCGRDHDRV